MNGTSSPTDLLVRSPDATWDRARGETIGDDGHRYEVIEGVLYTSTAPSPRHQWIGRQLQRLFFR